MQLKGIDTAAGRLLRVHVWVVATQRWSVLDRADAVAVISLCDVSNLLVEAGLHLALVVQSRDYSRALRSRIMRRTLHPQLEEVVSRVRRYVR